MPPELMYTVQKAMSDYRRCWKINYLYGIVIITLYFYCYGGVITYFSDLAYACYDCYYYLFYCYYYDYYDYYGYSNNECTLPGDFEYKRMTVEDTNKWHDDSVKFIKKETKLSKKKNQKCVVLTHHAPSFLNTVDPKDRDTDSVTAFATDLEDSFYSKSYAIHTWCHGHTHWPGKQKIANTWLISNQLGYYGKETEINEKFVRDICLSI